MLRSMTKTNLSTRKTVFGTTKQQEAFAKLCVLEGMPAVEAVKRVYSTTTHAASYASKLLASPDVVARREQLQEQQAIIESLTRDSLTADSIQIQLKQGPMASTRQLWLRHVWLATFKD